MKKHFKTFFGVTSFKIALLSLPLLIILISPEYLSQGESICLSKRFFNVECYGCGMTRAAISLTQFKLYEAWEYNKLSFIVFPLLGYLWFNLVLKEGKKLFDKPL